MAEFINERITVNIITPLVMYGSSQDKPEIRISSIKGALRWWLRALIGDVAAGKKIENTIFGSTSSASKLRMNILPPEPAVIPINKFEKNEKWRHELFYFNQNIKDKAAFECNTSFDISLSVSKFSEDEQLARSYLFNTLEIFSILGSLGARSRRGYGSISLSYSGSNDELNNSLKPITSIDDLKNRISNLIFNNSKLGSDLDFYSLKNASFYIGFKHDSHGFDSYDQALKDVIDKMRINIRSNKKISGYLDYIKPLLKEFVEKSAVTSMPQEILIESAIFGFPLTFQSRSLKDNSDYQNNVIFNLQGLERVSSPLLIKIIKIQNELFPLLIYFKNNLITQGKKIDLKFHKHHIKNKRDRRDVKKTSVLKITTLKDNIPKFMQEFLMNFKPLKLQ